MLTMPITPTRSRRASASRRRSAHSPESPPAAPPPVRTVYIGSDGTIYHARCGQPAEYLRTRGGLELDFYCLTCVEHITLAVHALPQVQTVGRTPEREATGPHSR